MTYVGNHYSLATVMMICEVHCGLVALLTSLYFDPATVKMLSNLKAARSNVLLAVPAFLYAINNYLKFTMQVDRPS
ncbi:unnamed protein product [Ilex paraguariensis]|uniref:Uncharacterized protein n=1 Tax=Ilex paraguariensis TaxID=185542 RepID=A0ABC8TQ72_9AQUA